MYLFVIESQEPFSVLFYTYTYMQDFNLNGVLTVYHSIISMLLLLLLVLLLM